MERMAEAALDFTSALTYYVSHHAEAYFNIMQSPRGVSAIPLLQLPPTNSNQTPMEFESVAEAVRHLLVARAAVFQGTGYLSQAVVDYGAVLRLAANHQPGDESREADMRLVTIATMVNRAYVYAKQGNHKRAFRDYSFVITLDPTHAHAYINRGVCCYKSKSFREAVDDFTKVIYMISSDASSADANALKLLSSSFKQRAKAYTSLGRQDLADKDRARAKKLEATFLAQVHVDS
jgi:tetratricopeptide (TPR) repeat protein